MATTHYVDEALQHSGCTNYKIEPDRRDAQAQFVYSLEHADPVGHLTDLQSVLTGYDIASTLSHDHSGVYRLELATDTNGHVMPDSSQAVEWVDTRASSALRLRGKYRL